MVTGAPTVIEYSIAAAAVAAVVKALDVIKAIVIAKKVEASVSAGDPVHTLRANETHHMIRELKSLADKGELGCKWENRDEVRDLMEALRLQTSASKQQTAAITALTEEMRRTRNGT